MQLHVALADWPGQPLAVATHDPEPAAPPSACALSVHLPSAVHVLHECSTFRADTVAEARRHCHQQRHRVVSAALAYQLAGHNIPVLAAALLLAGFGAALQAHFVFPAHTQKPNLCSILLFKSLRGTKANFDV